MRSVLEWQPGIRLHEVALISVPRLYEHSQCVRLLADFTIEQQGPKRNIQVNFFIQNSLLSQGGYLENFWVHSRPDMFIGVAPGCFSFSTPFSTECRSTSLKIKIGQIVESRKIRSILYIAVYAQWATTTADGPQDRLTNWYLTKMFNFPSKIAA